MKRPHYKEMYLDLKLNCEIFVKFHKQCFELIKELFNCELNEKFEKNPALFNDVYKLEVVNKETGKTVYGYMIIDDDYIENILRGEE